MIEIIDVKELHTKEDEMQKLHINNDFYMQCRKYQNKYLCYECPDYKNGCRGFKEDCIFIYD